MKVLFVISGNSDNFPITPFIKSQGEALNNLGINVSYFRIQGKGLFGYFKNVPKLRSFIRSKDFDLIHAHYGLSAIMATIAGVKPLIVSLMGSDVLKNGWQLQLIRTFVKKRWELTIVKTIAMSKIVGTKHTVVIPNGVDIDKFVPLNKHESKSVIQLNKKRSYILFLANPFRSEKNFSLAQKSFNLIKSNKLELICLHNISYNKIPYYINSADVVVLSSLWEGSPNVIKEAMACNCPIVSTDVGDVKWVMGDTIGCYIASFDPEDMAENIKLVLDFGKRTNGRQRIIELGLDSETVAKRIRELYKQVLRNNNE